MAIGFALMWLLFFMWRKDTRREMVVVSIIFGILGPLANILYVKDWWSPLTFDGTQVGIVDSALVGFVVGGITAVLFETLFSRTHRRERRLVARHEHLFFFMMFIVTLLLFFGGFYLLGWNSFISSMVALCVPTLVILVRRPDLLLESFCTGILLVAVSALVYNFIEIFTPGWIEAFWHFKNTAPIVVYNMPIDDAFLYFFLGMFGGPLYEYWQGARLVRRRKRRQVSH